MPRANRILQADYPYHVTLRSINKMTFELPMGDLWDFSCDLLLFCSYAFKIEIHAFVLMNNHYHMILRTPNADLHKFMNYFNGSLSREIGLRTSRINQKFGGRYHASVISDLSYYHHAYKYVYRNPVEAKVCEMACSRPSRSSVSISMSVRPSEAWLSKRICVPMRSPK